MTFTDLFMTAVNGGHDVLYVSPDAWYNATIHEAAAPYSNLRNIGARRLTYHGPRGPIRLVMRTPLDAPYRGETDGEKLRRRMYAVQS